MVDCNTIGAGGGSLAWIDGAGGLRVGPQSAGAEPGPACYGRGGDRPTVTDASVLLGYLNPANFAGGSLRLDVRAAERALGTVAGPLGLDPLAAAGGIHRVVNARMADQIRLMTIQRGHDPRGFTLVLLGGAGPVHGVALAEELGLRDVLVPWSSIERCKALQTFQVATPEGVFHGLGVSRSARSVMRQQVGGRSVLGTMFGQRLGSVEPSSGYAQQEVHTSLSYLDFIEARIATLAQESTDEPRPVVRSVAVLPVAALVAAALLLVAAIVG